MTWVLLLAAVITGVVASPARAEGSVDVNISSVSPQLLDLSHPDQTITISGTVRNNTDHSLSKASVHFWRSTAPITEHDDLQQTLTSEPTRQKARGGQQLPGPGRARARSLDEVHGERDRAGPEPAQG